MFKKYYAIYDKVAKTFSGLFEQQNDAVASRLFESQQKFLSTPSARRATAKTETKSLFSNKLYNILHEFRRALIYNGSKNYPNHAK